MTPAEPQRSLRRTAFSRRARPTGPINRLVHSVLLVGLTISAMLLVAGLIAWGARGGAALPHSVTGPAQAVRDVGDLRPVGFFSLGLLALILTPFARVAGTVVIFLREGDRRYAAITAAVLALMIASILLGRA
jgi:uncharacterized membrane protein